MSEITEQNKLVRTMYLWLAEVIKPKHKVGILIDRFQPFDYIQLQIILTGMREMNHFIVIIGDANIINEQNLFDVDERKNSIMEAITDYDTENNTNYLKKLTIDQVDKIPESLWVRKVNGIISNSTKSNFGYDFCQYFLYGSNIFGDSSEKDTASKTLDNIIICTPKY